MAAAAALTAPDIYWDDLRTGHGWRTQGRTITEPDLASWLNLTWLTEPLFTDLHERGDSAIAGRFVPGAMIFAFAEGLTLGAVKVKGLAFLRSELDVKGPTFVGDTVHVRTTVQELRETSKPDRGLALTRNEVVNQKGDTVLVYTALRMMRRRPPAGSR
mgnify:CR=1 FL=1